MGLKAQWVTPLTTLSLAEAPSSLENSDRQTMGIIPCIARLENVHDCPRMWKPITMPLKLKQS